ncbi:MAG: acyl-CoA/acyl-ACP dehydrogenase, partial [Dehalococcoidia bacterium]|nr:acyl-CoA/acyl-ACP dehydrogenase [Dehalococcoidia bacterium]
MARLADAAAPRAEAEDRDGRFPFETLQAITEAGLLRLTLPEEYGGIGADLATAARVLRRLAQGDAASALIVAQHLAVTGAFALHARDGKERFARHLRHHVARDEFTGLFAGAPEFEDRAPTLATKVDGGFRVSGRKGFATGCLCAVWAVSPAVWQHHDTRYSLSVLYRFDQPAVRVVPGTWDTLGMRATNSHDIVLTDLFVPDHDVLVCAPETGLSPNPTHLSTAFFSFGMAFFAGLYLGIADAAVAATRDLLRTRSAVGAVAPLSANPVTQAAFGEIVLRHREASAMFDHAITAHHDPRLWTEATHYDLIAM